MTTTDTIELGDEDGQKLFAAIGQFYQTLDEQLSDVLPPEKDLDYWRDFVVFVINFEVLGKTVRVPIHVQERVERGTGWRVTVVVAGKHHEVWKYHELPGHIFITCPNIIPHLTNIEIKHNSDGTICVKARFEVLRMGRWTNWYCIDRP